MRIALCQINTTVGDLDGNRTLILQAARSAAAQGAELAVFCELSIPGYPPRDLLDRPAFVDANLHALDALARELPPALSVLVGFVDRRVRGHKTSLYNSAALVRGGRIEQIFHKRLLPTYDVFDEARYFEPGEFEPCFELSGLRIGVTICEDVWNDADVPLRQIYEDNPVADCIAAGADLLVNLSASPFTLAKRLGRAQMLADIALRHRKPLVFVNSVGGNDDLVFDGSSALFGHDGTVWAQASSFAADLVVADLEPGGLHRALPDDDAQAALAALVLGTRDYAQKCGFRSAVIGLSGGIDSALVACVAVSALGADNVLGVSMPTRYSSAGSRDDARVLAQALGIAYRTIDIDPVFQAYLEALNAPLLALGPAPERDTTFENIQARIRGNTLMAISNRLGHLLLTTGNKSEIAVGYCTLYGDMAGGLAVISDLPKTFVYQVAREANRQAGRALIPESTFTKAPSAELRPNQTDQDTLPPYEVLDPIIERLVEAGDGVQAIIAQGFPAEVVMQVATLVRTNEYKRRQMPPGIIVTSKAFGPGRRYPIAQRFRG
ncbi:MAG TPA: NAD+ synthase [Polyangiales bacterium]